MRDLALLAFMAAVMLFALKRPFLFIPLYMYVDTVSPQRIMKALSAR